MTYWSKCLFSLPQMCNILVFWLCWMCLKCYLQFFMLQIKDISFVHYLYLVYCLISYTRKYTADNIYNKMLSRVQIKDVRSKILNWLGKQVHTIQAWYTVTQNKESKWLIIPKRFKSLPQKSRHVYIVVWTVTEVQFWREQPLFTQVIDIQGKWLFLAPYS